MQVKAVRDPNKAKEIGCQLAEDANDLDWWKKDKTIDAQDLKAAQEKKG